MVVIRLWEFLLSCFLLYEHWRYTELQKVVLLVMNICCMKNIYKTKTRMAITQMHEELKGRHVEIEKIWKR